MNVVGETNFNLTLKTSHCNIQMLWQHNAAVISSITEFKKKKTFSSCINVENQSLFLVCGCAVHRPSADSCLCDFYHTAWSMSTLYFLFRAIRGLCSLKGAYHNFPKHCAQSSVTHNWALTEVTPST